MVSRLVSCVLVCAMTSPALANPGDDYVQSLREQGQIYHDDRGVSVYRYGPDTVTLGPGGHRIQCHEFAGDAYCRGD